jgi:hypothetical protein
MDGAFSMKGIQRTNSLLKQKLFTILVVVLTAAPGCGEGPYAEYSVSDLQEMYNDCETRDSMSPGAAITCDNISRECDRRAKARNRKGLHLGACEDSG